MGILAEYVRITPAQLERATGDPRWVEKHIHELVEAELHDLGTQPPDARCLYIDKAWDAIRFLLERADFPVGVVLGEEEIPGTETWGYTPLCYLIPSRVTEAAEALTDLPFQTLTHSVRPEDLAEADVYPSIWAYEDSLDGYVRAHYESLKAFFHTAATAGDAVITWLG